MAAANELALARNLALEAERVRVRLSDGRELVIPFDRYRFLREATPVARAACVIDEGGTVLFWPALREGISLAGLLGVSEESLAEFAEASTTRRG